MTKTPRQSKQPRIHNEALDVPLKASCPHGFTKDDLEYIMAPEVLKEFYEWMRGQTVMLCNGKSYVHKRVHDEYCGHKFSDETTSDCGYTSGGHFIATDCSGLLRGTMVTQDAVLMGHGPVTYRWDVERFLERGWRKEIFD